MNEKVKSIHFLGTNFYGIRAREARTRTEVCLISSPFHEGIDEKGKRIIFQGEVKPLHDKSNTLPWHLRKLDYGDRCMLITRCNGLGVLTRGEKITP